MGLLKSHWIGTWQPSGRESAAGMAFHDAYRISVTSDFVLDVDAN